MDALPCNLRNWDTARSQSSSLLARLGDGDLDGIDQSRLLDMGSCYGFIPISRQAMIFWFSCRNPAALYWICTSRVWWFNCVSVNRCQLEFADWTSRRILSELLSPSAPLSCYLCFSVIDGAYDSFYHSMPRFSSRLLANWVAGKTVLNGSHWLDGVRHDSWSWSWSIGLIVI